MPPTLPTDYQYIGNDAFAGDPEDPANVGEFRHEERITAAESGLSTAQTDITAIEGRLDDLEETVYARVTRATAQTLTTGVEDAIIWSTVVGEAPATVWDGGTPTRLTIPYAGTYLFTYTVTFNANASGERRVYLKLNGSTVKDQVRVAPVSGVGTGIGSAVILPAMSASDYVEIWAGQTSGGNLNIATNQELTSAAVARIL